MSVSALKSGAAFLARHLRRLSPRASDPTGVRLSEGGAHLARRFAHLRPHGHARFFDALCNHLGTLRDDPCLPMYFEFAITCNERGRQCARMLAAHVSLRGARYLDVGCAYAGFLVAFAEQGAEVAGIDLDAQLLALAGHNLHDHGLPVTPLRLDITSAADMAGFAAAQDLVTCSDVIEHVNDPAAAIRNLAAMLRPGGLVYLEIPNRRYPPFVASDGHFQLFGITLLEREEAEAYYQIIHPGRTYTVGHYLDLEEYDRLFAASGLRLDLMPETLKGVTLDGTRAALATLGSGSAAGLATVPEALRARVGAATSAYLAEAESCPRETPAERDRFLARYGPAFWRILGRRSGGTRRE